ncbi:RNA polymerase sigma factor [Sporichthya brevicatena]|uniref:RNA polymerase sigma factor n=1 Tax=Sporichthya brevicatena TaxID=171442 RepID=A0ABN1H9E0_9ACTN
MIPDPIAEVFRTEYGRCVSTLTRVLGDISLAEDAVADAFTVAVAQWDPNDLPPNPGGWITTTARRRAIDRLRRESTREARHAEALLLQGDDDPFSTAEEVGPVRDDRLRMLFTCCHPALAPDARVALTLRLLGGLETPDVARAFLVAEPTLAQRIVRAKKKIKDANIPYRVPRDADLPERLSGVLAVIYLIYNAGHSSPSGPTLQRVELCDEGVRLARLVVELMPDEPEAVGLLALLLLLESRRPARTAADGSLVLLADQDRSRWLRDLIAEGQSLVRACLRRNAPGPYQIQAAINAVHADSVDGSPTDWRQIVALYDQLMAIAPTPVVALNRAVALAELDGPTVALAEIERLDLASYQPYWVARAELLVRADRPAEAAVAFDRALALTDNAVEHAHLSQRRAAL